MTSWREAADRELLAAIDAAYLKSRLADPEIAVEDESMRLGEFSTMTIAEFKRRLAALG